MKKFSNLLIVVLFVVAAAAVNTLAQGTQSSSRQTAATPQFAPAPANMVTTKITTSSPATQAMVNSLSTLPEADALIYINPQRILNDLLPKIMPAKELEEMRNGFAEVKKSAGIDPTRVEYIVYKIGANSKNYKN